MANIKITGYAELAAPISTDLVEVVSDPGGTPISKKVQIRNLFKGGGQIAFPATAVPSADPNTMDDWEEGTWAPTLTGGADLSGYDEAIYTKIGRICFFRFTTYNKNITTAGIVQVTLPFTSVNSRKMPVLNQLYYGTHTHVISYIPINGDHFLLYKNLSGASWDGNEVNVQFYVFGSFNIS